MCRSVCLRKVVLVVVFFLHIMTPKVWFGIYKKNAGRSEHGGGSFARDVPVVLGFSFSSETCAMLE